MSHEFSTRCIHLPEEKDLKDRFGAISFPIYQTATFAHPGVGKSTGYDYARSANPSRDYVERIVASLENGTVALGFSSGMAAIALVMELFSPGDHLIVDYDLYGGSVRLFDHISKKNGLSFTKVDCARADLESLITPQTKAIYLETPSNPMMRICDLRAIGELAKRHGLLLIVDNTFLSPYLQNPLDLGADVVVHSGTKYLGGHNDTLAGFLVVKDQALGDRLRFLQKTTGGTLSAFDAFLVTRGIKTLPLRMEKSQENAFALAKWLKDRPEVTKVFYPGFEEHPGHEIHQKQARGFGSMLSFETATRELAISLLENVRLIAYAESLGGTETLLTYPLTQTHADIPEEERLAVGITDRLLRLSVGIEDVRDLMKDLEQAFERAKASV